LDGAQSAHAEVFKASIQELVDMIEKAQQEDGYLIIYFTVVDKEGRFKNLRDMHEMCESPLFSPCFFFLGTSLIYTFMVLIRGRGEVYEGEQEERLTDRQYWSLDRSCPCALPPDWI
jgi:DUF1680 family protein